MGFQPRFTTSWTPSTRPNGWPNGWNGYVSWNAIRWHGWHGWHGWYGCPPDDDATKSTDARNNATIYVIRFSYLTIVFVSEGKHFQYSSKLSFLNSCIYTYILGILIYILSIVLCFVYL